MSRATRFSRNPSRMASASSWIISPAAGGLVPGRVREAEAAHHVSDGVDRRHARAHAIVGLDAARPDTDTDVVEPEALDVGAPPGGHEQLLGRPTAGLARCRAVHDLA